MTKKTIHACILILLLIGAGIIAALLLRNTTVSGNQSFDFGFVKIPRPSKTLEHTFHLTNVSDHELRITNAIPSCACSTISWSPDVVVAPGQEFILPVTLDMQRSQYRSATVRLEFASGEMEVLRVKGVAHFEQPLQCLPPTILVASDDSEGSRSIVSLEWYEESTPPVPTFVSPENIIITADSWIKSRVGNPNNGTPDIWTIRLKIVLVGVLESNATFSIMQHSAPELIVPLTLTDSIEHPNLLKGGSR